jgi:hypothetical protein
LPECYHGSDKAKEPTPRGKTNLGSHGGSRKD